MYSGTFGRQMQLADVLTYVFQSRGAIWGFEQTNRSDYLRIILLTVNQLLLQEHVTYFPSLRRKFQKFLEDSQIAFFLEDEDYKGEYEAAKQVERPLTFREDRDTYWAVDHLLPKSIGLAVELLVYLYLLRNNVGYVVPLLLQQRLLGSKDHLIAPDFLVIRQGRVFGVEVEQGGRTGKIRQSNTFMQESGMPILTASIPTTFPMRCKVCNRWILFCDNVIDKFSDLAYQITSPEIVCDSCNQVVYYGRLEKGGDQYHYHLKCVDDNPYVKAVLSKEEQSSKRLIAYFPHVEGLERLVS
jgi:hypothetical protein